MEMGLIPGAVRMEQPAPSLPSVWRSVLLVAQGSWNCTRGGWGYLLGRPWY